MKHAIKYYEIDAMHGLPMEKSMLTASEMAELDRRIEVMKAYRDGEKIQAKLIDSMSWTTLTIPPAWAWNVADYRIVPEPRKPRDFWLQWDVDGQLIARTAPATQFGEVLHVREVLPD